MFHRTGVVGGDEVAMDAELSADLIEDERKVLSVMEHRGWRTSVSAVESRLLLPGDTPSRVDPSINWSVG